LTANSTLNIIFNVNRFYARHLDPKGAYATTAEANGMAMDLATRVNHATGRTSFTVVPEA
jgi:hypothetical protein